MKSRAFSPVPGFAKTIAAVASGYLLAAAALRAGDEFYITSVASVPGGLVVAWDGTPPRSIVARAAAPDKPYEFISDVVTGRVASVPPDGASSVYRVQQVNVVYFPDVKLAAIVRAAITNKRAPSNEIYDIETAPITSLNLVNRGIANLSGIEFTGLSAINVSINQIATIEPLRGMPDLTRVDLFDNQISNLQPLAGLGHMTSLDFSFNQVADLQPLTHLVALTRLVGNANQITSLQAIAGLTNLVALHAADNLIGDLQPLLNLQQIKFAYLANNQIQHISALVDNAGVDAGDTIDLRGNPLSVKALNIDIPALTNRGVFVMYDINTP